MYAMEMSEGSRGGAPAEARRATGVTEDKTLIVEMRNGEFVVTAKRARRGAAHALFQKYCPPVTGRALDDDRIAERRAETARENNE